VKGPRPAPLPHRPVWVNGRIVDAKDAALSLFDRGARDGEGLFETLRVYRGEPFQWKRHLERMVVSAGELGFPVPPGPELLLGALRGLLDAAQLDEAVVRVTVTRGIPGARPGQCGAWIEAEPLEGRLWPGTRKGGAKAIVSRVPFEPGYMGRHKTTSRLGYHLAREEARAARVDETLLASRTGEILEGSVSNVFLARGGRLVTPPLKRGVLPGITRAWVLRACTRLRLSCREASIKEGDFAHAEEAFLTNSVQEIVPLVEVDGRAIPLGTAAARLQSAYQQEVERLAHA